MHQILVIALLAFSLAACGSTPAAQEAPTAPPATVVPTAAPSPIPSSTVAPSPPPAPTLAPSASAGLGISRAVLQSKFEGAPFMMTFQNAPDRDGAPVVRGISSTKGITIELIGPAENVQEAQVQITVGNKGASSHDAVLHMLAMLEVTTPSIKNPTEWLAPRLDKALETRTDTTIEGGRTITIITAPEISYILLSVLPAPK